MKDDFNTNVSYWKRSFLKYGLSVERPHMPERSRSYSEKLLIIGPSRRRRSFERSKQIPNVIRMYVVSGEEVLNNRNSKGDSQEATLGGGNNLDAL